MIMIIVISLFHQHYWNRSIHIDDCERIHQTLATSILFKKQQIHTVWSLSSHPIFMKDLFINHDHTQPPSDHQTSFIILTMTIIIAHCHHHGRHHHHHESSSWMIIMNHHHEWSPWIIIMNHGSSSSSSNSSSLPASLPLSLPASLPSRLPLSLPANLPWSLRSPSSSWSSSCFYFITVFIVTITINFINHAPHKQQ